MQSTSFTVISYEKILIANLKIVRIFIDFQNYFKEYLSQKAPVPLTDSKIPILLAQSDYLGSFKNF